jgi:hypothetical protein
MVNTRFIELINNIDIHHIIYMSQMTSKFICLMVFIIFSEGFSFDFDGDSWLTIPLPRESHFLGHEPPTDAVRWRNAQHAAKNGELIFLNKIFEQIHRGEDIYSPDVNFRWIQRQVDMFFTDKNRSTWSDLLQFPENRAPIVHLGHKGFTRPNYEGESNSFDPFDVKHLVRFKDKIPRKFIAVGCMDSNWGYLSTAYVNRYCLH